MDKAMELVKSFGLPRLIITLFLLALFVIAPFAGINVASSVTDVLGRFGQNAIMVLAMVPMIHSGCGLNFGLPLGIISGLLGATLAIETGIQGPVSFLLAILYSTPFALIFGWGYGKLLNRVKGSEMMIATYVGFSSVAFMSIMWLILPSSSPTMVWGYSGSGLRTTISTDGFYSQILHNFLCLRIVCKTHEIEPQGFDSLVILSVIVIRQGVASAGEILMSVGPVQRIFLSVEHETVPAEREPSDT